MIKDNTVLSNFATLSSTERMMMIYRNIPGYDGKYIMYDNGDVWNAISQKRILPKVRGKMKLPSYRLYDANGVGHVKSVETWYSVVFPEKGHERKNGFMDIPGYQGLYGISTSGEIWSYSKKRVLISSPTTTCPYLCIKLSLNNKVHYELVHRLVAMTYIPNPDNLPEVDHIDRNIMNNNVSNLRWINRIGNLKNSSCGLVRNFRECSLFYNGTFVGRYQSICEASREGHKLFGASYSGLNRNLKSKGCEIKSVTTSPLGRRVG